MKLALATLILVITAASSNAAPRNPNLQFDYFAQQTLGSH
jgi:hypothetical protein